MVKVMILFGIPADAGVFDEYFDSAHRALLNRLPGVEQVIINRVAGVAVGDLPYHLIVEVQFQSEEQMQHSLNSENGQAMAQDYSQFATGGTTILFCHSSSMAAGS